MGLPPPRRALQKPTSTKTSRYPAPGGCLLLLATISVLVIVFGVRDRSRSGPTTLTANYRAAAEELVRQRLRDPNSAEFSNVHVIPSSLPGRTTVCGIVNARNGFGGMTGPRHFVAGDTVVLEGEVSSGSMDQLWQQRC
jgi:hypothetical protein